MRLLNTTTLKVDEVRDDEIESYAILSHTWGQEEVTIQDMEGPYAENKEGYKKIKSCCSIAKADGFDYIWVDTCCIDKTSSAELSEAINSMYRWYQEATVCYAYLADVSSKAGLPGSRWFTRGWTLQELIAPSYIIFFGEGWKKLGTKTSLRQDLSDCTGIPIGILSGEEELDAMSIAQRMSWAARRQTLRIEDRAYCLMGIFGINMPLIYGEQKRAFIRLQEEIMKISDDHSIFAWKSLDSWGGILATSPAAFIGSGNIIQSNPFEDSNNPSTVSNMGVHLNLRFIGLGRRGLGLAVLHCKEEGGDDNQLIAICVEDSSFTMRSFERVWSEELVPVDLRKLKPSRYPIRRICIRKEHKTRNRESKSLSSIFLKIYIEDLESNEEQRTLLEAVIWRDEDSVWRLLAQGDIDINFRDENGQTALWHAMKRNDEKIMVMLLARSDIEANKEDDNGQTPLAWAAQNKSGAMVQLLLKSGKVNVNLEHERGQTPLYCAASVQGDNTAIMKLLVENGADIEPKGEDVITPILAATKIGNETIVRWLIQNGADIESEDEHGIMPILAASQIGNETIVRLLISKGADIESGHEKGLTPLLLAAENGNETIVRLLISKGADIESGHEKGLTPLLLATVRGHEAIVKILIDMGANIEARYRTEKRFQIEPGPFHLQRTPLSYAAGRGHMTIVQLLIENNANIDSKDSTGWTPLLHAVKSRDKAIVQLLLSKGANTKLKSNDGQTALTIANRGGRQSIRDLIRKHQSSLRYLRLSLSKLTVSFFPPSGLRPTAQPADPKQATTNA